MRLVKLFARSLFEVLAGGNVHLGDLGPDWEFGCAARMSTDSVGHRS